MSYESIEKSIRDLNNRIGSLSINAGTLSTNASFAGTLNVGAVTVSSGTVNIDMPTVPSGTLKVNVVAGGAGGGVAQLQVVDNAGAWENVGLGTYRPVPVEGTVKVSSGTVNVASMPAVTVNWSGQEVGVANGTLRTVTEIGTLPPVVVGSGTLQAVTAVTGITNPVTVTWGLGTVNPTDGTLSTVTRVGTLPNIVVGSGTLQTISGNVNVVPVGLGTVKVDSGTVAVSSLPTVSWSNQTVGVTDGTLRTVTQIGTLPNIIIGSGTLTALTTLGTITNPVTVTWGIGTVGVSEGTLNSLGSANVYAKHDLMTYSNLGAAVVASGTLISAVANKVIKVHSYAMQTDGTWSFRFLDAGEGRGTLGMVWNFNQREGMVSPFLPYPAYHFKTSAGSALFVGTFGALAAGTLNVTVVYSSMDAN